MAILIGGAKGLGRKALTEHLLLAATTVVSSWCLIHTVFAMHYAHGYYHDEDEGPDFSSAGGLEFPNEKEPDFLDFAYFSFRDRNDLPGFGCAGQFAGYAAPGFGARFAVVRVQYGHPGAFDQSGLRASLVRECMECGAGVME